MAKAMKMREVRLALVTMQPDASRWQVFKPVLTSRDALEIVVEVPADLFVGDALTPRGLAYLGREIQDALLEFSPSELEKEPR